MSTTRNISARQILLSLAMSCCLLVFANAQAEPVARRFGQVAISRDGTQVAWVVSSVNATGEPVAGTEIYIQDLKQDANKAPRQDLKQDLKKKPSSPLRIYAGREPAQTSDDNVAWSPDGKHLAFLSNAGGTTQLYVFDLDSATTHRLTNLIGFLDNPVWSPDGKTIAFLFIEDAPRASGPLMPMSAETGVIEQKVYEQRLAVIDVASGKIRQLSPPDMYVYEYDWSPDGKSFAAIAARGSGDANWYVAQLYTLGLDGGEMRPIYKPSLQIADPRWSPDGKSIAFITGLMSDEGSTGGDIFLVSATGGDARNLTPALTASPSALYWSAPDELLFTENIDGQSGVSRLAVLTGQVTLLWSGEDVITTSFWNEPEFSISANLQSAVIRHSWHAPPEIWVGPIGAWKQVTHFNDSIHSGWGRMTSLHWENSGQKIQGWLLYPHDYNPNQLYPLVVVVHGGPASAAHAGWPSGFFNTYELSSRGYFVLYPNPRGSYGQGETFTQANVKDFGYGDFRDILAGVDEVIRTQPVDHNRIGITGWSYGGYMTMWAVTQIHRFHAAVAGAGVANFQSYYGQNDIDEWMIPYFGVSVYQDPAIYMRSSPISFVDNVKTPTLVLVGERDGECPPPQSREFWHALKSLGVDTQLVIYPGEGHVFLLPEHRRDVMDRTINWFDRYLKAPAGNP